MIVLGSAALLEVLQLLTPDRHRRLLDAIEKIVGDAVGIAAGRQSLLSNEPVIGSRTPSGEVSQECYSERASASASSRRRQHALCGAVNNEGAAPIPGDEDAAAAVSNQRRFGKRHDTEMTFKPLLITKLREC